MTKNFKNIRVEETVHNKLLVVQTKKKIEKGKNITIGEIIDELLDV